MPVWSSMNATTCWACSIPCASRTSAASATPRCCSPNWIRTRMTIEPPGRPLFERICKQVGSKAGRGVERQTGDRMNAAALKKSPALRARWLGLALGLLIAIAPPAQAQSADPPARVGRVAEVVGEAWLFDTETKEWTRVLRNQTVGEGDRLRTDERARVSLRIGSVSLWLDERSDLEFNQLDEGRVLLQLDKGDLGLRLRSQDVAGDYRVQTREGLILPERDGLYRVEQLDRPCTLR
eukprot:Opistho-2@20751